MSLVHQILATQSRILTPKERADGQHERQQAEDQMLRQYCLNLAVQSNPTGAPALRLMGIADQYLTFITTVRKQKQKRRRTRQQKSKQKSKR